MSDGFFTKPRPFTKRKREDAPGRDTSNRNGVTRGRGGSRGASRGGARGGRGGGGARGGGRAGEEGGKGKRRERDEELDDGKGGGGFDTDSEGSVLSGEGEEYSGSEASDDELETPAQKRLRLAQMYLQSLEKNKPEGELQQPRFVFPGAG